MDKKEFKKTLKKVWYFLWESNSIWSWIANIIIAFILIKFIVYPGLGFILHTSHPIVAVVSGSMEHDGNFDDWWNSIAICERRTCTQKEFYNSYNITKEQFLSFKYKNGFNIGDIMVLKGLPPENIQVGDIIVFNTYRPDPIIHRNIKIWQENDQYYFQTKGDHNLESISSKTLNETKISSDKLIGKAVFRIPYLGWIKIGFVRLLQLLKIVR
ncbi:signal peptidase I [Candidatus Woesearchaeota archaeon]|nr:signal peptidase I [Candidatus Woesearchaeota archaeon]